MKIYFISYDARDNDGNAEHGIARIEAERKPGWADCYRAIPGFIKGEVVSVEDAPETAAEPEPARYRIEYDTDKGHHVRHASADAIERSMGPLLSRAGEREIAWNIAVYDPATGEDVTFDFECFAS